MPKRQKAPITITAARKAAPKVKGDAPPVEAIKHKDRRVNIPTEELKDFVRDEDKKPSAKQYPRGLYDASTDGTVYKRDPSLDPQLVWRGKDQQDSEPFNVPIVPVYIQEKIHPQAIIENVRREAAREARKQGESTDTKRIGGVQAKLFAEFNGIKFEELIDFYKHDQKWSNRMVLGDSLLVMASLAEKEGLKGKVQMIYLDPPYGIKFGSNWQVSTRSRDVKDGSVETATRQPEQIKAFRDTWANGLNSYLTYIRDRLILARELLTTTGSLFLQIGDENLHVVRAVVDEVFGATNFISQITLVKTTGSTGRFIPGTTDYILWYAKDQSAAKYRPLVLEKAFGVDGAERYDQLLLSDGTSRPLTNAESDGSTPLPAGSRAYSLSDLTSARQGRPSGPGTAMHFPVQFGGRTFFPAGTRGWSTTASGLSRLIRAERVSVMGANLRFRRFLDDFRAMPLTNVWGDVGGVQSRADPKVYVVQTSTSAIERCMLMTTDAGDLVLDPTCGSGTTAYVAEQWGRRWITTDTSRVALALARTRLMAAKFPFYLLADSPEGRRQEAEITGRMAEETKSEYDVHRGFVYKRVPHITLKAIANNEEIDTIPARFQEQLELLRAAINKALRQKWEEWEMPRQVDAKWPKDVQQSHERYWQLRRERQAEIDASIARKADVEFLYDQPYEDPKRVRVSGPFTVESLSPHRQWSAQAKSEQAQALPEDPTRRVRVFGGGDFGNMIIENLKKAGVQNTKKGERLMFDSLEVFAGEWIQAKGIYTEKDGKQRTAAVCIGPEFGTVGSVLIQNAAKEAVRGVGFDVLIVCGFAFDPTVNEEAKRYGKLQVLVTKMNPDLAMGDELLKKTGAANLFMVFGEPDIEIQEQKDGKFVVEIKGVDVYDPTTGEIRSSSTDDIACWFIDTNYNDESFFVRHAYFTGSAKDDEGPYDRLKRALRSEINEDAWSSLYTTKSAPFDPPGKGDDAKASKSKGKIAVKVINHYGDEVLKVYEV